MIDRRVYMWGAAILATGAAFGIGAAVSSGVSQQPWGPGSLAIGGLAYAIIGALILHWGLAVYGRRGALGAVALTSFTPVLLAALATPPVLSVIGAATLVAVAALLAAVYALTRGLLDPTVQSTLVAAIAIVLLPFPTTLPLPQSSDGGWMVLAGLSVILVVCRAVTAERWEPRRRVLLASTMFVALTWGIAIAIMLLLGAVAPDLPSAEDYSAPLPGATMAGDAPASLPSAFSSWTTALPLASLVLVALRPWRWERRYSDAAWSAALLGLAVLTVGGWGEFGAMCMAPFAALLAGACWHESQPIWRRRIATGIALAQIVAALLLLQRGSTGALP